jgi:putative ABC transport system permease protein
MKKVFPSGVRRLFRLPETRDRLVQDADEEMRVHVDSWIAEYRARGRSDADAQAAALRRFGDPDEYRRHAMRRAERKARWQAVADWFAEWRQDVRFALRHFAKAPGFTAVAVITLALGIGANTAIYSVVHRLLIAPLPYPNGDRVVALKTIGRPGFTAGLASFVSDAPADPGLALIRSWTKRAHSFTMMAGVEQMFLAIQANGQQDTVAYALATANLLDLLGTRPAIGRMFRPDEEKEGARHVAMISHRWWQLAYGGRADALGKVLEYEGEKYTIVGVMPVGFTIPMAARALDWISNPTPDVWLPTTIEHTSIGFGLLRDGVSQESATRELNAIANTREGRGEGNPQQMFAVRDSIRARAMRAQDFVEPKELRTIEILFAAVGALLLIACANVANLLLVRAWSRRREFAVRLGLGAGRARLIRLALTESVLLALVAGIIGLLIAWQGLRVIVALRPLALDRLADVQIQPAVLFWTAGISIFTGVLFGGAAAFFVASQNVADLLRSETRTTSGGGASRRVRSSLIVAEIALSFALLVCAGLLARSFAALQRTPLGFDPHNLVSIDMLIPPPLARTGQRAVLREGVARRLGEIPGVTSAAFGMLPTAGYAGSDTIIVDGPQGPQPLGIGRHMSTWIDTNYFHTAGVALLAGRTPRRGASDEPQLPTLPPPPPGPVLARTSVSVGPPAPSRMVSEEIVVNGALARRIAPNGNALGMRIRLAPNAGIRALTTDAWSTIVGIAEDVQLPGARGEVQDFQIYSLAARMPLPTFVVRFATVPPNVESVLRQAVQSVNPTLIARRARVGDDYLREALAPTRFALALLSAFAGVALVLSVVGLYGSIAYSVTQRTREIGIRIALGATPKAVAGLVISDGVRLSAVGLVVGIATAAATTRALSSLLYSVGTGDPMTFVAIAALVGVVALAASYLPARRATSVDPVNALRAD